MTFYCKYIIFFFLLYGRMSFPQKLYKISCGILKITEQRYKIYFCKDPTSVKSLWPAAESTEQGRFKSELGKILKISLLGVGILVFLLQIHSSLEQ